MPKTNYIHLTQIIEIFNSDMFDNDVWDKIDHLQSIGCTLSSEELIDIYDNMDN